MESLGGCCTLDIDTFRKTRDAVERAPEAGKGSFETVTEWRDGAQAVTRARSFTIETDEPTPLGGKDQHVDPMELLLAALGSCLTIGWVTQARLRGITYHKLVIKVQAPFDLRGYLALEPSVRPGFGQLRYTVDVDTDADAATLEEIRIAVERTSPMFDNILRPTPIEGIVQRPASMSA
ncbi:OsmC family protein [Polyangium sp. 15x6]|uniref:OsmC family protein n=1 Tax=Polyangium sp. 15x6 TaxID=3042687 RepID=UPI002499E9D9|nr:OsmC family protein [Polyangium sp. 15x6]MDI3283518.1 OsmC family protein [Polyangium sp. 15x6]